MGERVVLAALASGVSGEAAATLARAHRLSMGPRERGLAGEHAPEYLHPGRTALILLGDAGEARTIVLAAGMLAESERPALRLPPEVVAAEAGEAVAALAASVPLADADDLAERLVVLPEEGRLVALAERLDHLRHAHLWPERARRREAHERAVSVYLPVAERTHAVLARRYRWWCGMFGRRWV